MDIVIKRKVVSFPILPVVAGVFVLLMGFLAMSVGRIQANEIGVLVNNVSGNIEVVTSPGAHVYNGFMKDFFVLDNTEQSYRMAGEDAVNIKTREGADVSLDVVINYRLVADPEIIKSRIVPECGLEQVQMRTITRNKRGRNSVVTASADAYKLKWTRDYARSIVRFRFGELVPTEFYDANRRNEKAAQAMKELNDRLNQHGIQVTIVVPEKFHFYAEYETMIEEKKEAEQEAKAQQSLAEAALEAQKREETKADALKNIAIAQMGGELKKAILEAEADAERELKGAMAYEYTTKTAADANFYKAKNEAKSLLALAEADASGLTKLAESLSGEGAKNLLKLQYAKTLSKARITGVPYSTDPRIQKVQIDTKDDSYFGGKR